MEAETISEESHKKGRIRRKQILNTILNQMHFYFSDSNLSKDRYLGQLLNESEYINLDVFLSFNKIKKLTTTIDEIVKAIKKSNILELNDDCTKVKRKLPIKIKGNTDECTIYVQTLQPDTSHEWLHNIFSEFGNVEYISIPRYGHNKLSKGFAFIEFASESEVKNALDFFEAIGCRISSQFDAEQLCSNLSYEQESEDIHSSFEKDKKVHKTIDSINQKIEENDQAFKSEVEGMNESETDTELNNKKRKGDVESDDNAKRFKTDEAQPISGSPSNNQSLSQHNEDEYQSSEDNVDKNLQRISENDVNEKKKKKSNKRKSQLKDLGLQVLTKLEWKKLRNRYWDMQRKKMKQLKLHLNKRRLQQSNYLDIKNIKTPQTKESVVSEGEEVVKDFTPGLIVKLKLDQPWTDAKKIKIEMKNIYNTIQYVEVPITLNSDELYLRFMSSESAKEFCKSNNKGQAYILENDEERLYWQKIQENRNVCHNREVKKQRGRDKLLKRAERELGKHIRFEDSDE